MTIRIYSEILRSRNLEIEVNQSLLITDDDRLPSSFGNQTFSQMEKQSKLENLQKEHELKLFQVLSQNDGHLRLRKIIEEITEN